MLASMSLKGSSVVINHDSQGRNYSVGRRSGATGAFQYKCLMLASMSLKGSSVAINHDPQRNYSVGRRSAATGAF